MFASQALPRNNGCSVTTAGVLEASLTGSATYRSILSLALCEIISGMEGNPLENGTQMPPAQMDAEGAIPIGAPPPSYGSSAVESSAGVADGPLGPVKPNEAVKTEVRELLENNESRLGEVYRALNRGLTADAIANELGVATSNFVWNYQQTITALLEGELPTAPTVALQTGRRFRGLLKRVEFSLSAREYLERNLVELERRANDETARVVEVERAKAQTERAEAKNEAGIYVYSLPHYIRYPYEPETGHTLMKVGRSDSDVIERFRNQTRTTALPEEPILLRIYRTDGGAGTALIEATFHRLLIVADHHRSVARTAGREWFTTTTKFLDEIAHLLQLPLEIVNDADDAE